MKLREGFVSNSSSSSFVISKGEQFKDMFELAMYMVKLRDLWDDSVNNKLIDKIKDKQRIGLDKDIGIFFKSCNYDTFIRDFGDNFLIYTCNNHDWDLWGDTVNIENTKDIMNWINSNDKIDLDNYYCKMSYYFDYWMPEYNTIAREIEGKYCDKCHINLIKLKDKDEIICPKCIKVKIKKHYCDTPVEGVACTEKEDGTFWFGSKKSMGQVNFCPVCGNKARNVKEE